MNQFLKVLLLCAVGWQEPMLVLCEEESNSPGLETVDAPLTRSTGLRGDDARRELSPEVLGGVDWGLRFNKFAIVVPGGEVGNMLPLGRNSYPLRLRDARILRRETSAVSVFHPFDMHELWRMPEYFGLSPDLLLRKCGVKVLHPTTDPNNPFWANLLEVIQAQIARIKNDPVDDWLTLPVGWEGYNLTAVAEAVHDEFPGSLHIPLIKRFLGGPADRSWAPLCPTCARIDRNIIPSQSSTEFIRGSVMLSALNTWSFGAIGPMNFAVKWNFGVARPEEVAWAILQGRRDGVPAEIIKLLDENFANITKATQFTAYPEGSPNHPSFPAMHAACAAASLWMAVVFDLTPAQHCEVKRLDYAIAYARTVAGVHYPSDNIAGLNMGQEILAQLLPFHLAETYGANRRLVREKVDRVRFDWNNYLDGECF